MTNDLSNIFFNNFGTSEGRSAAGIFASSKAAILLSDLTPNAASVVGCVARNNLQIKSTISQRHTARVSQVLRHLKPVNSIEYPTATHPTKTVDLLSSR